MVRSKLRLGSISLSNSLQKGGIVNVENLLLSSSLTFNLIDFAY